MRPPFSRPRGPALRPLALACFAGLAAPQGVACGGAGAERAPAAAPPASARRVAVVSGFDRPETVKYDPDQDAYFVSNMVGNVTEKDGNGFISRVEAAEPYRSTRFIVSGRDGAVLHGPKGMALRGGVLWVADIDALRGFDARTGRPVETVDLGPEGAASLNDVDAGPDGTLYVTDPRYIFHDGAPPSRSGEDRVFAVAPDKSVRVVLRGDALLMRPNGVAWDASSGQLLIAPLEGKQLFGWRPGEASVRVVAEGPGSYDGLEPQADGRVIASSFEEGGVILAFGKHAGDAPTRLIEKAGDPANVGTDTRRRRLAIPLIKSGRVELWQL